MTKAVTSGAAAPSGAATYDSTAQAVHWLVAALAVITVPLGWAIAGAPRNTPQRDLLLLLHRFAGLAISCGDDISHRVALAPPAATVAACSRPVGNCSRPHHALCPLPVPYLDSACRILNAAAAGHAVDFFGVVSIPPLLPENDRLLQVAIASHLVAQYPLYLFIALHIAGALFHGTIRAMGSSSVWFRYAVPASRLPCLPG